MGKTAKALVFVAAERRMELREYPVVDPPAGMVGLELLRSGVCGTDRHFLDGTLPPGMAEIILGHEFVGRVDRLGAGAGVDARGRPLAVGDAVIVCIAVPCGGCPNCRRGETSSCMDFGMTLARAPSEPPHLHGGFAEYQFAPAANVIGIPAGLPLDAVAAFPCAGPTVIRAFAYGGGADPGDAVVVQGTGTMGLFAIAYAKAAGCRVLAVGSVRNAARVALAKRLGADDVLDYRAGGAEARAEAVREWSGGHGADLVVETSGAPSSFAEGLGLLRIRGRYLVPGQYSNSGDVAIPPQAVTFKALRITGSGQYNVSDVDRYLAFLRDRPEVAALLAETANRPFRLEEFGQAFAAPDAGGCLKTIFADAAEAPEGDTATPAG